MLKYSTALRSAGLMGIMLFAGVLLSWLIFSRSTRAGQINLSNAVDVAATAHVIQSQKRQGELEMAIKLQKASWEAKIAKKQQALTEFNHKTQTQISELQAQLLALQTEINQAESEVDAAQTKLNELRSAALHNKTELADFEAGINRLEDDLQAAQSQLQAARGQSGRSQASGASEVPAVESTTDDGSDNVSPERNQGNDSQKNHDASEHEEDHEDDDHKHDE